MKTKFYLLATFMLSVLFASAQDYNVALVEEWSNNAWVNNSKSTNVYDIDGRLIQMTMEDWENGAWQNSAIIKHTLNGDGTIQESITQAWQEGEWTDVMKTVYTYSPTKQVLTVATQMGAEDIWFDLNKITYTYDENDRLVTQVTQISNFLTQELINAEQNIYTYNANGTENQVVTQTWSESGEWVNSGRYTNTYNDAQQVTSDLNEIWENNAWVNDQQSANTYTAAGFIEESTVQDWVNNAWVNNLKDVYTYNSENKLTAALAQEWNATLSQWDNSMRITYDYGATGIDPVQLSDGSLNVFPNPFTGQLTIQSALKGAHTVEVFDLEGRKVYSAKNSESSFQLELGWLKNGAYLIRTPQNNQSIRAVKTKY